MNLLLIGFIVRMWILIMNSCLECPFVNEVVWCTKLIIDVLDYCEDDISPSECPLNTGSKNE